MTIQSPFKSIEQTLNPFRSSVFYDRDAQAYLNAVEDADGQLLEVGVKDAINAFVVGCKSDGIWDAIKASCILAGARTLAGALVPLVGTAPTNFNFVSADYNRETGLVGDGSTKYLDCNIAHNHTTAANRHASVFATSFNGNGSLLSTGNGSNSDDLYRAAGLNIFRFTSNVSTTTPVSDISEPTFQGASRSSSSFFDYRVGGVSAVSALSVGTTIGNNYNLLRLPSGIFYAEHRISFYSIGESLDLDLLDARVTDLMTAIGAAI